MARLYQADVLEQRQKLAQGEAMIFDDYGMDPEQKEAIRQESIKQDKQEQDGFGQI